MLTDARTLPKHTELAADLCIVGAGVAGLTLARALMNRGLRVIVLESGGAHPTPSTQRLAAGPSVGRSYHPYSPLDHSCRRAVGGTSWAWHLDRPAGRGVRMRALDAIDFTQRSAIPHSGWPIAKEDLDPYYARAHTVFGLGPYRYDPAFWDPYTAGTPLPLSSSAIETTLFQFADASRFTEVYPRQVARSSNIHVFSHATVTALKTNESANHVTAVEASTLNGRSITVRSARCVLAAGGIQNPRLLLLSDAYTQNGLGNDHDLVGRFFMEHLHRTVGWFVPSSPDPMQLLRLYRVQDTIHAPVLGYLRLSDATLRKRGLLNYCTYFHPEPDEFWLAHTSAAYQSLRRYRWAWHHGLPDAPLEHLARIGHGLPELLRIAYHKARRELVKAVGGPSLLTPRNFRLCQMAEQAPNPASRVTLDTECDAFGQPRARLRWQLIDKDLQDVHAAQTLLKAHVRRQGLGDVIVASPDEIGKHVRGGGHHMGTTRMSDSPTDGVVDRNCKVHGVDNLFVAGSSVFPTGGVSNPTLTIAALALRLADHLNDTVFTHTLHRANQSTFPHA